MIAVVDYQAGNIGSILNMLKKLGASGTITANADEIQQAEKIILPGVGSFDYGMSKLKEMNLLQVLDQKVKRDNIPILGICLGAQLMCKSSEEGVLPGLGWIDGVVKKFPTQINGRRYSVPHMGWDIVHAQRESKILLDLPAEPRFYFVHSYHIICHHVQDSLLRNEYGVPFDSAFEKGNIIGVQFHPEKSHRFGKQLLKNFIELY